MVCLLTSDHRNLYLGVWKKSCLYLLIFSKNPVLISPDASILKNPLASQTGRNFMTVKSGKVHKEPSTL